jgi:hypothetical protein
MGPRKTGGKPASRPSATKKAPDQSSGVPTWPRVDLSPPEHMLSGLRDSGRVALTSGYLAEADYAVVQQAVKELRMAEPELLALLGRMNDPALARTALELIAGIAGAAYVIGAHGAMTDTAERFFKASKAAHMRFQRPQSKREQAVTKAIESAIHQAGLGHDHPFKSADLLLEPVNEDLGARGYKKGISRSTLYRRLKRKSGLQE